VVKVPSLTVKLPRVKNPRPSRDVPDVSGTLPVPVAGAAKVTAGLEAADADDEAVAVLDVLDVLLAEGLSALCTAFVSAVLTRSSAVWLAMLASPVDSVVVAPNIWSMTAELSSCARVVCWELAQKLWSCCQNERLPMLVIALVAPHENSRH
jgi:energy-converting hydrogenase Eha subunit A